MSAQTDEKLLRLSLQGIEEETDLLVKAAKIQYFAQQCRIEIFDMLYKRGNGHWGGYAGLSDSFDGASHQSITDIAVMRAMPNLNVIVPADSIELIQALEQVIRFNGPSYIRICRNPTPVLFEDYEPFKFGKIRKIQEGTDITIAACGVPVYMAMKAADELQTIGISAEVLNVSTIKPIDSETLVNSVRKTGCIITVEEHTIIGGMGSAVAETLMKKHPVKMDSIGISDVFTETGPYMELLKKYGISKEAIVEKALKLVRM